MAKLTTFSMRIDNESRAHMKRIYNASNTHMHESAFYREIILGNIKHPFFEKNNNNIDDLMFEVEDHKVEGPEQTEKHYLAVVIAALMLRIKLDPEYHRYRKAEPKMFQKLIDEIRGYEYDEKSQVKKPLKSSTGANP